MGKVNLSLNSNRGYTPGRPFWYRTLWLVVEALTLLNPLFVPYGIKARILRVKELPDLPDIRLGSNGTPSTIDVCPLPPRNQVTLALGIAPAPPICTSRPCPCTLLGTPPSGPFGVEP